MNRLDNVEKTQLRENIPAFQSGDTVKVHVRIQEGNKERLQVFEGVVIARKHGGSRESITVRKVSFGVGVERIFPLHDAPRRPVLGVCDSNDPIQTSAVEPVPQPSVRRFRSDPFAPVVLDQAVPDLDAGANAVAITTIKLVYEWFERDLAVTEPAGPAIM